jgi:dTDP-4-dehydrorhamnose reductase
MVKVLITGSSGRLGKYVAKEFPDALLPSHSELDVADYGQVDAYIADHKPDVVIHMAAWVDVRGNEGDKEKAWRINVGGTENVVNALSKHAPSAYLVYISTACVFRGDRGGYTENDVPYPVNFYGLTKLVSEYVVKRMASRLIIRTDFVERAKWRYEGAYVDRFSTCVFSDTLAREIKKVVDSRVEGLIHLTGKRRISHYNLARITTPEVKPIKLADEALPMPRDQSIKSVKGYDYIELEY